MLRDHIEKGFTFFLFFSFEKSSRARGFQDGSRIDGSYNHLLPEPNWITTKLKKNHPKYLTED